MAKLITNVTVCLEIRDGETIDDANERLFNLLYDGLCNAADHICDFTINEVEAG